MLGAKPKDNSLVNRDVQLLLGFSSAGHSQLRVVFEVALAPALALDRALRRCAAFNARNRVALVEPLDHFIQVLLIPLGVWRRTRVRKKVRNVAWCRRWKRRRGLSAFIRKVRTSKADVGLSAFAHKAVGRSLFGA